MNGNPFKRKKPRMAKIKAPKQKPMMSTAAPKSSGGKRRKPFGL